MLITPRPIWPIRGGDSLRAAQAVEALASSGLKGTVIITTGKQNTGAIPKDIIEAVKVVNPERSVLDFFSFFKFLIKGDPLQLAVFSNRKGKVWLNAQDLSQSLLVCHTVRSSSLLPDDLTGIGRLVFDFCDSLPLTYQRYVLLSRKLNMLKLYFIFEIPRLRRLEKKLLEIRATSVWISEVDQIAARDLSGEVIENWVVEVDSNRIGRSSRFTPGCISGIMVGNFRSQQNQIGLRLLHEWTKRLRADGRLNISIWGHALERYKNLDSPTFQICGEFGCSHKPYVNTDLAFCLTPMSGGLQNKILEAAIHGVPSVLLPNTATSSAQFQHRVNCLVVRDQWELEAEITALDHRKYKWLSKAARDMATYFGREKIAAKWRALLEM